MASSQARCSVAFSAGGLVSDGWFKVRALIAFSSSEVEEPPPRFHFAETPDDLTIQNTTENNEI